MGRRLAELDWFDLLTVVRHSPPTSALHRAMNPDAWVTPDLLFLRDIEHRLSWLVWAKSADAEAGKPPPTPVPLTAAERQAVDDAREHDVMTLPEALAFLGWGDEWLTRLEGVA